MGLSTATSKLQKETEDLIEKAFKNGYLWNPAIHEEYLMDPLEDGLNRFYVALDASKPWLIYWILHSLDLLGVEISEDIQKK